MVKRPVGEEGESTAALKHGKRPQPNGAGPSVGFSNEEFEDEFEDEYESDDEEVFEAGVDGRPDAEREAEEKGTWATPVA